MLAGQGWIQGFALEFSELREYSHSFFSNIAEILDEGFAQVSLMIGSLYRYIFLSDTPFRASSINVATGSKSVYIFDQYCVICRMCGTAKYAVASQIVFGNFVHDVVRSLSLEDC